MARPLKVAILACSASTTGEVTMALDWATRCKRPMELHLILGTELLPVMQHAPARLHTFPTLRLSMAIHQLHAHFLAIRPDVVVVADLLLAAGLSPEFGAGLVEPLLRAAQDCRVVALDLYDLDETAPYVDIFGRPLFLSPPRVPPTLGRLLPAPANRPGPNTPGRGRYMMMDDQGPVSEGARQLGRKAWGVMEHERLVLCFTSPWQHRLAHHPEGRDVATHFPALMLRLLDEAAGPSTPLRLVHVGPQALPLPADVANVAYRHTSQLPPEAFAQLMQAADLVLSPNCPASSAVRAASMRIPVATLHMGQVPPQLQSATTRPQRALAEYLHHVRRPYPFSLWPLGMFDMMQGVLRNNPFAATQRHLDVVSPDDVVANLRLLLHDPSTQDELRHQQEGCFSQIRASVGTPDDALAAALEAQ